MMKSKLWVKILAPILIIAVIGGIWIVKNATEKSADDSGTSQNNTELSDDLKDADFSLRETKAIDFEALSAYGLPIIIDYGADSCIPCKQMAPVLEKANKEFYGKAFVKFINVCNQNRTLFAHLICPRHPRWYEQNYCCGKSSGDR